MSATLASASPVFYTLWNRDGRAVAQSLGLPAIIMALEEALAMGAHPSGFTLETPDGREFDEITVLELHERWDDPAPAAPRNGVPRTGTL